MPDRLIGVTDVASGAGVADYRMRERAIRDPETINYQINPSVEVTIGNWGSQNAAVVTRDTGQSPPFGTACAKVVTSATQFSGINNQDFSPSPLGSGGGVGVFSFYAKGTAGNQIRAQFNGVGPNYTATFTLTGAWARYEFPFSTDQLDGGNWGWVIVSENAGVITYYVDAVQMEMGAEVATPYVDGSLAGAEWLGTAHQSASRWSNPAILSGEQYLIETDERVASCKAMCSTFRTVGTAAAGDRNYASLFNKAGSGVIVAVRRLSIQIDKAVQQATARIIAASSIATAPTTGVLLTPTLFDSTKTQNASVEFRGDTASDGAAMTILTATPGARGWGEFQQRIADLAPTGQIRVPDDSLLPLIAAGEPVYLREGEGILVTHLNAAAEASETAIVNVMWGEFTLP